MLRSYLLPVITQNGATQPVGLDLIHDAVLLSVSDPALLQLLMDTTTEQHDAIIAAGATSSLPTPEEEFLFHSRFIPAPPSEDVLRAQVLLATSPEGITQPEMWELVRIFGRLFGIPD